MRLGDLDDLKVHISELMLVYSDTELNNAILNAIDNAPTVEAIPLEVHEKAMDVAVDDLFKVQEELNRIRNEKRQGEWIFGSTLGHSWMKCSNCCVSQSGQTLCWSYCPNCGAKMKGGAE